MKITLTLTIDLPDGSPVPNIEVQTDKAAPPPAAPKENVSPLVSNLHPERPKPDGTCEQCGNSFKRHKKGGRQKFCSDECRKAHGRAYARDWYSKNRGATPKPEPNKNWGIKVTDGRTQSRKPSQNAQAWNGSAPRVDEPKERIKLEFNAQNQVEIDKVNANFQDPWDCGKCRNCLCLCPLHEDLMMEGKRPPQFRVGGGSSGSDYIPGHKLA